MIGKEIADRILPYAQQSNARLLQFVPKEILDQYNIDYVEGSDRITAWRFIGESASSDDEEMGEDEIEDMDADSEIDVQSGQHAGELSLIKDQTISSDKSDNLEKGSNRRYSDSILDPEDKKQKSAKKSVV